MDKKTESEKPVNSSWYRFIGAEDEDKRNEDTRAGDICGSFLERTTSHGLPLLNTATGFIKKVFWFLATCFAVGALCYHLTLISMVFWRFEVDVLTNLEFKREMTFPAITICNMNPVKKSVVPNYTPLYNIIYRQNQADLDSRVIEYMAAAPNTTKIALGYTQNDTILECVYAGSNCDMSDIFQYLDPVYGSCYMFNTGWNGNALVISKRAGRRHGLHLVLNVKQSEYIDGLSDSAGMRIVIHPQNRMPFPSDEGLLVTPGQLTSIGIRQLEVSRLGGIYGTCQLYPSTDITRNVYEELYAVKYSANACFKTCYQSFIIKTCSCADAEYPTTGTAFNNTAVSVCQVENVTQNACVANVSSQYQSNLLPCNCPVSCYEIGYAIEASSVEWPSEVNENYVTSQEIAAAPELTNATVRSNLLKAEIFFQEFNLESLQQVPHYVVPTYLSDIGGILGLWVGCSILSLFEFMELFADMLVLLCYKCRHPRSCCRKAPTKTVAEVGGLDESWSSASGLSFNDESPANDRRRIIARRRKFMLETPPPPYASTEQIKADFIGSQKSLTPVDDYDLVYV